MRPYLVYFREHAILGSHLQARKLPPSDDDVYAVEPGSRLFMRAESQKVKARWADHGQTFSRGPERACLRGFVQGDGANPLEGSGIEQGDVSVLADGGDA